jgi:hypothetical protein
MNHISKKIHFLYTFALIILLCNAASGQDTKPKSKASHTAKVVKEKAGRPDVPGDLTIELGLNYLPNPPQEMSMFLWGSKTFNIYYQHEVQMGDSRFFFFPGIGVGTEKYALNGNRTLGYVEDDLGNSKVEVVPFDIDSTASIRKSKINANYIDLPMEMRWYLFQNDPKRSPVIILGGKIGYRLDSKTKVKYNDELGKQISKQKDNFDLADLRYGAYVKVGYGSIKLYYYYSINPLFQTNRGPSRTSVAVQTFGISMTLF